MKPSLRILAVCLLLWVVGGVSSAIGDEPQKTARCVLKLEPEIDCPSCEDRLHYLLTTAHGVHSAEIDVLTNRIAVVYEPGHINVKALIGRIAVTGYTASEVK